MLIKAHDASVAHYGVAHPLTLRTEIAAMALEGLGSVDSAEGRTVEAEALLREAVSIREKTPDDIWELAEAQERLGEALLKGGNADAAAMLKKASIDLESQLGANHPQTLRARQALARAGA